MLTGSRIIFTALTVLEGLELRKNNRSKMGQPETTSAQAPHPAV